MAMYNPFCEAEIEVLWDVNDCPIPYGHLDTTDVKCNITRALQSKGYHGLLTITAFGDLDIVGNDFNGFCIFPTRVGANDFTRKMILLDFLSCSLSSGSKPKVVLLIVGDISRHKGFKRAIDVWNSKRLGVVLLAQPQKASQEVNYAVSTEWLWEKLATASLNN